MQGSLMWQNVKLACKVMFMTANGYRYHAASILALAGDTGGPLLRGGGGGGSYGVEFCT